MYTQTKAITLVTGLLMLASLSSVTAQRTTPTPRPPVPPAVLTGWCGVCVDKSGAERSRRFQSYY